MQNRPIQIKQGSEPELRIFKEMFISCAEKMKKDGYYNHDHI